MSEQETIAFMSYAHADDKHEHVTRFCERLSAEVGILIGREFPIFQDSIHIHWGEDWRLRIKQSLGEAVFLIPILTPSFFNSPACRDEVEMFLQREKALKRNDLILPVYFVDCDVLHDRVSLKTDALAREINKHQRADWRKFRLKSYDDAEVSSALEGLARGIKKALQRTDIVKAYSSKEDFSDYQLPANLEKLIADLVSRLERQQADPLSPSRSGSRKSKTSKPPAIKKSGVKSRDATRRVAASPSKDQAYSKSVFISTPLTDFSQPMFEAAVFAVTFLGFSPRSAFETSSAIYTRLPKIMEVIGRCKFGVFDISGTELSNGLPRFNVPFELGIFLGGWRYGSGSQKQKCVLVLDSEPYRYQKFISDLSGRDIAVHANSPKEIINIIHDWLSAWTPKTTPGGSEIYASYRLFRRALPKICKQLEIPAKSLSYIDYKYVIASWLKEYGVAKQR
jgi:hypothetical protein